MARDKGAKYAREGKDQATQKASSAAGAIKGKAKGAAPGTAREPAEERLNDAALKAKVESEIFREPDAPKGQVSVSVEAGTVSLRGQIDDPAKIEQLREAAAKVDGVRGVESLLETSA